MMLSILFMNAMAPIIDHYVVEANIRRRNRRLKKQPNKGGAIQMKQTNTYIIGYSIVLVVVVAVVPLVGDALAGPPSTQQHAG